MRAAAAKGVAIAGRPRQSRPAWLTGATFAGATFGGANHLSGEASTRPMMAPLIPTELRTERLLLRRPQDSDLEPYVAFYATQRSALAMGPKSRADAVKLFTLENDLWQRKGFGNYSVLLNDQPIGMVGVWQPDDWDEPEIGWMLWDGYEGRGYATEAAVATRDLIETLNWPPTVSYIHVDNAASKAVARRLGATFETAHPTWSDTEIWRHRTMAR